MASNDNSNTSPLGHCAQPELDSQPNTSGSRPERSRATAQTESSTSANKSQTGTTDTAVLCNIDRNMGLMTSILQKLVNVDFSPNLEQNVVHASDKANDDEDRHSVHSAWPEADALSLGAYARRRSTPTFSAMPA